ncbi:MAG: DUF488 domain-containing protein [Candidatus Nomurabacteria bacterium]|nr:DUF488 domain-containing protein [Candidatus Nomurabacteria bacterium]
MGKKTVKVFNREFAPRYFEHLRKPENSGYAIYLAELALDQDIVVMCTEKSPKMCHRRLYLEYAKSQIPKLEIDIK